MRPVEGKPLTALAVKRYADDASAPASLHDGGGPYLRKHSAELHWTLRLTDPATGADQWHRLFPDVPHGSYPHKGLADARTVVPAHDTVIETDEHVIIFLPHKRLVREVEKLFQVRATFL